MSITRKLGAMVCGLLLTLGAQAEESTPEAEVIEGKVVKETLLIVLELLVAVDGKVKDVRVFQSSGIPEIDKAALEETRTKIRKLTPIMRNGKPVEMWGRMNIKFKLVE